MKHLLNTTATKQTFQKILERLQKVLIFLTYLKIFCKKFINYESYLSIIRPTKKELILYLNN